MTAVYHSADDVAVSDEPREAISIYCLYQPWPFDEAELSLVCLYNVLFAFISTISFLIGFFSIGLTPPKKLSRAADLHRPRAALPAPRPGRLGLSAAA